MADPTLWGSKLHINTTTIGPQIKPDIASRPDGSFVATWIDTGEIRSQIFNADGTKRGGESIVADHGPYTARTSSIAVLSDGRFVITWSADSSEDSNSGEVWARIFNVDGSPAGNQFQVNLWNTTGRQHEPTVTALSNGGFVISFTDRGVESSEGNGDAVRAQAYDANGNRFGGEVAVNTTIASDQNSSYVLGLGGGYAVFFNDTSGAAGTSGEATIRGRIFSAEGEQTKAEFLLPATPGTQFLPKAAVLKDGRFVVTWSADTGDGDGLCIKAKVFNADGTSASGEFIVNRVAVGNQALSAVTELADGGFAIAYQDLKNSPGPDFYLATFDASGQRRGSADLLIGSASDGAGMLRLELAALADGRIMATWDDSNGAQDSSGGVFGQIIDPREQGVSLNGTGGNDHYIGTRFNDVLNGAGGADTLNGGDGDDTYHVDQSGDVVIDSSGTDTVVAAVSYALGAGIENFVASGAGAIGITGNGLANALTGNAADNTINGGAGADRMDGGAGNDTYFVDQAGDVVIDASGVDTVAAEISYTLSAEVENLFGTGAASLVLTGNALGNVITGNNARGILRGETGNDVLKGGADADRLYGGLNNDLLEGGAGRDVFVFNTKLGTHKTDRKVNFDTIDDFNVKDDGIWLESAIFKAKGLKKLGKKASEESPKMLKKAFFKMGTKAKDKDDYLIYNKKKGVLMYDVDGSGSKKAIEIAQLDKKLKFSHKDLFIV